MQIRQEIADNNPIFYVVFPAAFTATHSDGNTLDLVRATALRPAWSSDMTRRV